MYNARLEVIRVEASNADKLFDEIFQIRREVFVDELHVDQENDYDGFDHMANHYLVRLDGKSVATGRWRRVQTGGRYRIERIAVKKSFRGMGTGTHLIQMMLGDIPKDKEIFIHVQVPVMDFFANVGFKETGFVFEEAGISHKKMIYEQ